MYNVPHNLFKMCFLFLISLYVLFIQNTVSAETDKDISVPEYSEVQRIANEVSENLQEHIKDKIYVVSVNRKEMSPVLAVTSEKGMCIVVLNTAEKPWNVWRVFTSGLSIQERDNMVALAIAHELGHCKEKEIDVMAEFQMSSEEFTDSYGIAYLMLYSGDSSYKVIHKLLKVRDTQSSLFVRSHNTYKKIKEVYSKLKNTIPDVSGGNSDPYGFLIRTR